MSNFHALFDLAITHQYFADGPCRNLSIEPGSACRALLARARLLLRPNGSGMTVFYQAAHLDLLRDLVDDAGGALALDFTVWSGDPHFPEYSLPSAQPGQVLWFDSSAAMAVADGRRLLHDGPCADAAQLADVTSPAVQQALAGAAPARRPAAVVRIVVTAGANGLCDEGLAPAQRQFGVHFAASTSRWKYYLLGLLGDRQAYIADLDQAVGFDCVGRAEVERQAPATVFLSAQPIAAREHPGQRFQLRERTSFGDKILIKRMPNARAGRRFREVVDGQEVVVSEIFINP